MGFCQEFAEKFVALISFLIIIASIVAFSYSVAAINKFDDELEQLDQNSPPIVGIIFSVVLFIFALIGMVGALARSKAMLIIFVVGCGIAAVAITISGIVVISQAAAFDEIDELEENEEPGLIQEGLQSRILHFEIAVFAACCQDVENFEQADDNGLLLCSDRLDIQPCADDEELFEDFLLFLGGNEAATCEFLKGVERDGIPMVSDDLLEPDVCLLGLNRFVNELNDIFKDNIVAIGVTNLVIGIVLLFLMVFSCVLICSSNVVKYEK